MRSSSRAPLVPKEIIVPVCQRLGLVLFVMSSTALFVRMYSIWHRKHLAPPGLGVNGTHFFLDIGSGNNGVQGYSHTKTLEENGWHGVCADPFTDQDRSCMAFSMPVTPTTGQNVKVNDCTGRLHAMEIAQMYITGAVAKCPVVERAGMGIVDVLKLGKAPHLVDYVSLDTDGLELEILKRFPFKDHCVRTWTVSHRNDPVLSTGIQQLLAKQSCRVKDIGESYWAKCPCAGVGGSLLSSSSQRDFAATADKHLDSMRHKMTSSHNAHSKLHPKKRTTRRKAAALTSDGKDEIDQVFEEATRPSEPDQTSSIVSVISNGASAFVSSLNH